MAVTKFTSAYQHIPSRTKLASPYDIVQFLHTVVEKHDKITVRRCSVSHSRGSGFEGNKATKPYADYRVFVEITHKVRGTFCHRVETKGTELRREIDNIVRMYRHWETKETGNYFHGHFIPE